MPYKNQEKQKESARDRQRKHRQGVTKGVTSLGCDKQGVTITIDRAIKLLWICNTLDKTITGLAGKKENMLDLVRYGSISMRTVKEKLS